MANSGVKWRDMRPYILFRSMPTNHFDGGETALSSTLGAPRRNFSPLTRTESGEPMLSKMAHYWAHTD